MAGLHDLPEHVFRMIESGVVANFATMTMQGTPIDTPTYYFPADDMATIDLATGVPNPAKAERARRNAKVGLLIEGRPDEPVVVIRARAAVRDADIQANAIRYLAETGYSGISHGITWEQARLALTYWSRIIIENTPERIYWWDSRASLDGPAGVWNAAPGAVRPQSDPAPKGKVSPGNWPTRPWQDVADEAVAGEHPPHLTVVDADGFPAPMRVTALERHEEGFKLVMPRGMPWRFAGRGSVTFAGFRTFAGVARPDGDVVLFQVERAMPQNPTTLDPKQVLQPAEDMLAKRLARLEHEMARLGQPLPIIPDRPPQRTRIAQIRMARIASDSPITGITAAHGNRMG